MNLKQRLEFRWLIGTVGLALATLSSPEAKANVYATNIKLNDGTTNITSAAGQPITISYILNEPASLGGEVDILAGATVVRRIYLPVDVSGTNRGLNSVVWDGLDNNSNSVPAGNYQVSIIARSSGYTNWTQIGSDDDPGAYVYHGTGIAVDRNPNSLYLGRVFVANSEAGTDPADFPGDIPGILKLKADASFADEGASSGGQDGHDWTGNGVSPWSVQVSDDDFVYASDLALNGQVFRWDPLVSSNSLLPVLRGDNIPSGAALSGPAIWGSGTNTQIWMADTNGANGILKWAVRNNGACGTNDTGKTIVGIGTDLTNGLSMAPYAVALDPAGNIYTCQFINNPADPTPRVFRFPAYDPSTNAGAPELIADWAVGAGDDTYAGASGLAVDPTGTYLAVAFQGIAGAGTFQDGNTKLLYTTNGALAADIDLGLVVGLDATHQDTACNWDAVGNVYCVDNWIGRWRAFSPPGTNQSTTKALASIQITGGSAGGPPPTITGIQVVGNSVTIDFTATASDLASYFAVAGATVVTGTYSVISTAQIVQVSPGVFRATFLSTGNMAFYKIERIGGSVQPGGQAPEITSLTISNGTATLTFTGAATDSASQFSLLSSSKASGPYGTTGAQATQVSPGVFRVSVPTSGPMQFYRLQR